MALYQRPDPKVSGCEVNYTHTLLFIPQASQRQELFYSVPLPPHWIIEVLTYTDKQNHRT